MKKTLGILSLLLAMLMLVACGGGGAVKEPDFAMKDYANATYGISLKVPADWIETSADTLGDESVLAMFEDMGLNAATVQAMLQQVQVIFWDDANSNSEYNANMNLVASDAGGITSKQLTNSAQIAALTPELENQAAMIVSDFEWMEEPSAKTFGPNACIQYVYSGNQYGVEMLQYQAMMIVDDVLCTLTYSCPPESLDDTLTATLEYVMSTVQ